MAYHRFESLGNDHQSEDCWLLGFHGSADEVLLLDSECLVLSVDHEEHGLHRSKSYCCFG
jgi:hypothetical protein